MSKIGKSIIKGLNEAREVAPIVAKLDAEIARLKQQLKEAQKDPYLFGEQHDAKVRRETVEEVVNYLKPYSPWWADAIRRKFLNASDTL